MKKLQTYINKDTISFLHINRELPINEIEETMKSLFPLIYDSYKRGNGLALKVIRKLNELGQATIYGLTRSCNASEPAIINIVRRLEKKGYLRHEVIKGRGPKGSYVYQLTKLGEFTYYTVFRQRPVSWIIDTMLENIESETIKDTPVYHLVKRNYELLKNEVFRELLDYLFVKYIKSSIFKSIEDLFTIEQWDKHTLIDVLFIGSITPVVYTVVLNALSYTSSYAGNNVSRFLIIRAIILSAISDLSLIPIRVESTNFLPDFIEEIYMILNEVDNSIVEWIHSFSMDYLKYLIINKNWIIVKGAIDTWFIMKQLSGHKPSKKEISELKNLIKITDMYLNNILDRMDKLT